MDKRNLFLAPYFTLNGGNDPELHIEHGWSLQLHSRSAHSGLLGQSVPFEATARKLSFGGSKDPWVGELLQSFI